MRLQVDTYCLLRVEAVSGGYRVQTVDIHSQVLARERFTLCLLAATRSHGFLFRLLAPGRVQQPPDMHCHTTAPKRGVTHTDAFPRVLITGLLGSMLLFVRIYNLLFLKHN